MAIGADIARADPAVIRTRGMRAKMTGRIDLTAAASGEPHARWRCAWSLWLSVHAWIAELALWLASIARKRFGVALGSGWFRRHWGGLAHTPKATKQDQQQDEENTRNEIESQVGSHDQPSY